MKRLTKRDRGGNALLNCEDCDEKGRGHCGTIPCRNQLVQRLADFEEFGLEPADFKNILEEFVELKKAEADGRLVVLPCNVGDTVYIARNGIIHDEKVRTFFFGHPSHNVEMRNMRMMRTEYCDIPLDHIGKTVFFSYEKAEAALKKNLPRYDDDMTRPSGLLEDD